MSLCFYFIAGFSFIASKRAVNAGVAFFGFIKLLENAVLCCVLQLE